jgi:hypothetical protein
MSFIDERDFVNPINLSNQFKNENFQRQGYNRCKSWNSNEIEEIYQDFFKSINIGVNDTQAKNEILSILGKNGKSSKNIKSFDLNSRNGRVDSKPKRIHRPSHKNFYSKNDIDRNFYIPPISTS